MNSLSLFHPIGVLLGLLLTTIILIYVYATRHYGYWKKKKISYIKPLPFAGNLKDVVLFRKHIGEELFKVYNSLKDQPFIGMYFFDQPVLFVKDLDIWKGILHKDYEHFFNRGFTISKADTIFSETLFSRQDAKWKELRTKLSPAFTTGKLKKFYVLIEEKASNLDRYFDNAIERGKPVEMLDICGKYTTDVVATVGFGMNSDALRNENNDFFNVLRNVFVYSKIGALMSLASFVNMPFMTYIGTKLTPPKLADFLRKVIWATIEERENTPTSTKRNDFLDLLIELRKKGQISDNDGINERAQNGFNNLNLEGDTLIAQAFSFFSAGYETSASTMSFALYSLAMNKGVQDKLRASLHESMKGCEGKLTYDSLQSCSYLDMVVSETLRLYPILPFLDRTCTKTYKVPGTDLVIDKGVFVYTSLLGIQRDKTIYPNPEVFDPERFSEENKLNRHSCAYMPFGGGHRVCIGMRLALLQTKLGLAHIILNYELTPCSNTPKAMEYNLHSFLIQPRYGVPLTAKRVK